MSFATHSDNPNASALRPPRFTLRTLLVSMTALCCLFAVMAAVGLLWSAVLSLFLGLVLAHVLGNSLGTRLRDRSTRQSAAEHAAGLRPSQASCKPLIAAPQQLTERVRLTRITLLLTVGGALVGAELGGVGVTVIHPQAAAGAMVLGIVSSGVLGGFAGFLGSSFLWVVRQALAEAHRGAAPAARPLVSREPT
ncbi:MAG: hypothetical protein AB7O59_20205 [Pirellulales bacterium]